MIDSGATGGADLRLAARPQCRDSTTYIPSGPMDVNPLSFTISEQSTQKKWSPSHRNGGFGRVLWIAVGQMHKQC